VSVETAVQSETIFDVKNITLRFGGVVSLRDVSLHMKRGEILAVIGPNGAGKTSLFNSLTGVYEPQEGHIDFTDRHGRTISVIG
jgi:branched-chain amino acid transport system ATP-binding protein